MKAGREAAAAPPRPLPELPAEMLCEIFARLPPKAFLRCGCVCKAWHALTSERPVQLKHHRLQPRQHLVTFLREAGFEDLSIADFCLETLDLHTDKICSIVRFIDTLIPEAAVLGSPLVLHGSLQGVLLLSYYGDLFLCNPTTRRWALLDPIHTYATMVGLYIHPLLEEFRILYRRDDAACGACSYFVFEIVSGANRMIHQQELKFELDPAPICLRDRLYWLSVPIAPGTIAIFHTVAEVFESMPTPNYDENKILLFRHRLIDLDGQLAISIAWREIAQENLEGPSTVDLWALEEATWTLKCLVQLHLPSILQFAGDGVYWTACLVSLIGDEIVETGNTIIHYDCQGNQRLVLYSEGNYFEKSPFVLKESVVLYPYLQLNNPPTPALPFFRWL